jgi:hypothetical protein
MDYKMNHNQKKQVQVRGKPNNAPDGDSYISPVRILSRIPKEFLVENYIIRKDILDKRGYDIMDYTSEVREL